MLKVKQRFRPLSWVILLIIPIIFWKCYNYIGLPSNLVKLVEFFCAFALIIIYFRSVFVKPIQSKSYDLYIRWFIVMTLFTMLTSLVFWGQSPVLSFRAFASLLIYYYYFILLKYKVSRDNIRRILIIFTIIHIALWVIAILYAPVTLFGNDELEINDNRGFFRINIPGIEVVVLTCLLYFSDYLDTKSLYKFTISILLFIFIIFSLTRIVIVATTIAILYMILKKKSSWQMLIVASLISFMFFVFSGRINQFISDNPILNNMISMTEEHLSDKTSNNMRYVEFQYGFDGYNEDNIAKDIFGNGHPHIASNFGQRENKLHNTIGFNRSDSGYPSLFVAYGIFGLLFFFLMCYKTLHQSVNPKDIPYKAFFIFILIANLFRDAISIYGLGITISLYILEMNRIEKHNNIP